MPFQLVVLRGRSSAKTIILGSGTTIVGRQDGCQLQIRSSQVSRKHCELREQEGRLAVKDLNSSNGTFVNSKKISGVILVDPGVELSIGGVAFRVEQTVAGKLAPAPLGAAKKAGDTAVGEQVEVDADDGIVLEDAESEVAESSKGSPAASPKSSTPLPAQSVEPEESEHTGPGLSEDAVADFLFNLDVDEDDKV